MRQYIKTQRNNGFTIVELLIVVVVIAILAAVTIVAYNGITAQARSAAVQAAVRQGAKKISVFGITNGGQYPSDLAAVGVTESDGVRLQYSVDNNTHTYCLTASDRDHVGVAFFIAENGLMRDGTCIGHSDGTVAVNGVAMQKITSETCPSTRIRAVDARDRHTYWIQEMPDGKCWMLTNLSYAGGVSNGGVDSYDDVIPTGDGSNHTMFGPDNTGVQDYSRAKYYIPSNANPTIEPMNPSLSTDGGTTNPQYGYLYNWCATMGAHTSEQSCSYSLDPSAKVSVVSICPRNWRLPTFSPTNELQGLTSAIGATNDAAGISVLQSVFMAQRTGYWYGSFTNQNTWGYLWSDSTINSGWSAGGLRFGAGTVSPTVPNFYRTNGLSVRCVAV